MNTESTEPSAGSDVASPVTLRTLFQQIVRAGSALDSALESFGTDPEALQEATEALDAFELLERTSVDVVVPREVRHHVKQAAHHLSTEHLELARAEVARAGNEFERRLLGRSARS